MTMQSELVFTDPMLNVVIAEVKRFNWAANSKDFQINDFIDKFKNVILHIDYKTNLI